MDKAALIRSLKHDIAQLEVSGGSSEAAGSASAVASSSLEDEQKAFSKILRLASAKECCSFDVRARLLKEGYEPSVVESALARAQRCGAIDDGRYAESYVRSRLAMGKGLPGIRAELRRKGLDNPCWEDGLDEEEGASELERALRVLAAKPPRGKKKRDSAYRKLLQRGFSSSVASSAARSWVGENGSFPI